MNAARAADVWVRLLASLARLFYAHVRFTETRLRHLSTEQVRKLFASKV